MFFKDSKDLSLVPFGRGRLNQQEQSPSNSVCRLEPHSVQPLLLAQAVGSTLLPPGKIPSPTSPKRHLPPAAEPEAVTTALIAGPEGTFPWLTGSMHELCAGNHRKGASEQGQAPPSWLGQASLWDPALGQLDCPSPKSPAVPACREGSKQA